MWVVSEPIMDHSSPVETYIIPNDNIVGCTHCQISPMLTRHIDNGTVANYVHTKMPGLDQVEPCLINEHSC